MNLESPEILEVVGMLRNSAMLFEDICSFQQCASSAGAKSRVGDFWAWNSECIVAGQKLEKVCDFLSPRLFQPVEQPFQPQSPSLGICHFGQMQLSNRGCLNACSALIRGSYATSSALRRSYLCA